MFGTVRRELGWAPAHPSLSSGPRLTQACPVGPGSPKPVQAPNVTDHPSTAKEPISVLLHGQLVHGFINGLND